LPQIERPVFFFLQPPVRITKWADAKQKQYGHARHSGTQKCISEFKFKKKTKKKAASLSRFREVEKIELFFRIAQ
jgi:hypothetical protein